MIVEIQNGACRVQTHIISTRSAMTLKFSLRLFINDVITFEVAKWWQLIDDLKEWNGAKMMTVDNFRSRVHYVILWKPATNHQKEFVTLTFLQNISLYMLYSFHTSMWYLFVFCLHNQLMIHSNFTDFFL